MNNLNEFNVHKGSLLISPPLTEDDFFHQCRGAYFSRAEEEWCTMAIFSFKKCLNHFDHSTNRLSIWTWLQMSFGVLLSLKLPYQS